MRSWLSVLITDAESKKVFDIPIAPSLYSLSNKMDNSLLAVRDINHKYIVVESILRLKERAEKLIFMNSFLSHIKSDVKNIIGSLSRIESFPIDLGDSYEKVLNSCGLDEYDQNSVIITRNRVLEEIRSSIHQRRGNSLKSTMLDLKAYTTDYAKQQCDDLQEQLKELSDEKDVLKKDNDKKDKRVSECNAKITELESYYYKYITLCDYIVRINANPVREVITETIMRYSKKEKSRIQIIHLQGSPGDTYSFNTG